MAEFKKANQRAAEGMASIPSIQQMIEQGGDPQHSIYVHALNLMSFFGEEVLTLPPAHKINDFYCKWLKTYTPNLPPISPISKSYFFCWVYLDAAFGGERETVGTCFVALQDRLSLHPGQIKAVVNLNQSRMGIYEVLGGDGCLYRLRELITDKQLTAHIYSGYRGRAGEIIYIRLVPPLINSEEHWIGLTTPYLLVRQSEEDWLRYFARQEIIPQTVGVETRLYRHMKDGKDRTYWSEYAFYGYCNYGPGVIVLTGFPDQPETQPAHVKYRGR